MLFNIINICFSFSLPFQSASSFFPSFLLSIPSNSSAPTGVVLWRLLAVLSSRSMCAWDFYVTAPWILIQRSEPCLLGLPEGCWCATCTVLSQLPSDWQEAHQELSSAQLALTRQAFPPLNLAAWQYRFNTKEANFLISICLTSLPPFLFHFQFSHVNPTYLWHAPIHFPFSLRFLHKHSFNSLPWSSSGQAHRVVEALSGY